MEVCIRRLRVTPHTLKEIMGKHSPVAVAPKYMETFQCAGSACEENCCHGWRVSIDKHTFKKYRSVSSSRLNTKLKSFVIIAASSTSAADHAQIKLDADGNCPFLDDRKLCEIQDELGADYLSTTCQTYPRQYLEKNEHLEMYANLSCPEAARMALLDPHAMVPVKITLPFANRNKVPVRRSIRVGEDGDDVLATLFEKISQAAVHIISDPASLPSEAMIIVAVMVRRLVQDIDTHSKAQSLEIVAERVGKFLNHDYLTQARTLARGMPPARSLQLKLLKAVVNVYFAGNIGRPSYREMTAEAMSGILFDDTDLNASEARYNAVETQWFLPFDTSRSYILRNYLLNDLAKNAFPLGKGRGLEKEFIDIALRFSLIRMHLVGMAGVKKEKFSEADYVRVIYTFSRNIEHHRDFIDKILTLLDQDDLGKIATTAILLR